MNKIESISIKQMGNRQVLTIKEGRFIVSKNVIGLYECKVTPNNDSAKVDCPRDFIGKDAYLIIYE